MNVRVKLIRAETNVSGEKCRQIRLFTSVVQKRFEKVYSIILFIYIFQYFSFLVFSFGLFSFLIFSF